MGHLYHGYDVHHFCPRDPHFAIALVSALMDAAIWWYKLPCLGSEGLAIHYHS